MEVIHGYPTRFGGDSQKAHDGDTYWPTSRMGYIIGISMQNLPSVRSELSPVIKLV